MAEYLNFSKGKSEDLNKLTTFKVGTIYVCTDNGELYLAVADSTTDSDAAEPTTETLLKLTGEDCGESTDTLTWSEWPHNRDVYTPETYNISSGTYYSSNFHDGLKSLNNPKLLWNQEIEIETVESMVVDGLPNIDRFKLFIDLRNDKYYITFYEPGSDDESESGTYKYSFTDNTVPSLTFNTNDISIVSDYVRPIFENYFTISEPYVQEVPVLSVNNEDMCIQWTETVDTSEYEFVLHGEYTVLADEFADVSNRCFTISDITNFMDESYIFENEDYEVGVCPIQIRSISSIDSDIMSEWSNTIYLKRGATVESHMMTADGYKIIFTEAVKLSSIDVGNEYGGITSISYPAENSYTEVLIPSSIFTTEGSYEMIINFIRDDENETLYQNSNPCGIEYVYQSGGCQLNTNYDESQHKEDGTNYYVYNSGENTTLYLYIRDDDYDADCMIFTNEDLIGTSFNDISNDGSGDSNTLGDDATCIRINCDDCDNGQYQSFNITQNTTFYVLPAYYSEDATGTFEFGIYTYDPASGTSQQEYVYYDITIETVTGDTENIRVRAFTEDVEDGGASWEFIRSGYPEELTLGDGDYFLYKGVNLWKGDEIVGFNTSILDRDAYTCAYAREVMIDEDWITLKVNELVEGVYTWEYATAPNLSNDGEYVTYDGNYIYFENDNVDITDSIISQGEYTTTAPDSGEGGDGDEYSTMTITIDDEEVELTYVTEDGFDWLNVAHHTDLFSIDEEDTGYVYYDGNLLYQDEEPVDYYSTPGGSYTTTAPDDEINYSTMTITINGTSVDVRYETAMGTIWEAVVYENGLTCGDSEGDYVYYNGNALYKNGEKVDWMDEISGAYTTSSTEGGDDTQTISFTINSNTFSAPADIQWYDFIGSEYDTSGGLLILDEGDHTTASLMFNNEYVLDSGSNYVVGGHSIIDGAVYTTTTMRSPDNCDHPEYEGPVACPICGNSTEQCTQCGYLSTSCHDDPSSDNNCTHDWEGPLECPNCHAYGASNCIIDGCGAISCPECGVFYQ